MEVSGHVALVTGAGVRVGRAIALALGAAGARVAVHYRSSEAEARAVAAEIAEAGGEADVFRAELSDRADVAALVPAVVDRFGSLAILVNNASVFRDLRLPETGEDDWDENLAVNLTAPFLLAQAMSRRLNGAPGKIVNLNDWKTTRPKRFAYGVSKAALGGLTRNLAAALAPAVQVNEVALGAILLPPGAPPGYEELLASKPPAKRMGTPEEVAAAVMALISNDYITGETLYVDGGQRLSRT